MNEWITAVLIGLLGWLVTQVRSGKKNTALQAQSEGLRNNLADLKTREEATHRQLAETRAERENYRIALSKKEVELQNAHEKLEKGRDELEKLQEKFTTAFENLANKILEEKSEKFTLQNRNNLESLLNPLGEKIKDFEEKVARTNEEHIARNEGLKQQITSLKELNEQITQEANNLTKALKGDSKTQGNWGELVLERILEKSGLEKGREFDVQQRYTAENGLQQRPDVIIHLADDRSLIIDSKVSLTDYEKWCNEVEESKKARFLKLHLASVERHIKTLSDKNYHMLYQIGSPEFVLMFVPIEPAFAAALIAKQDLYDEAYKKNVIIVTPSILLATLRTIYSSWQSEKRQRNAAVIARQAGALYDRFSRFVDDLETVGKRMDSASASYSQAMNKLCKGRGNLVSHVENLRKLGAQSKKRLAPKLLRRADEGD
ncbi:MAG: DNA recombination protein RmuC [Flavobacteriales bacterium]